jgi:hypothetical protein
VEYEWRAAAAAEVTHLVVTRFASTALVNDWVSRNPGAPLIEAPRGMPASVMLALSDDNIVSVIDSGRAVLVNGRDTVTLAPDSTLVIMIDRSSSAPRSARVSSFRVSLIPLSELADDPGARGAGSGGAPTRAGLDRYLNSIPALREFIRH